MKPFLQNGWHLLPYAVQIGIAGMACINSANLICRSAEGLEQESIKWVTIKLKRDFSLNAKGYYQCRHIKSSTQLMSALF